MIKKASPRDLIVYSLLILVLVLCLVNATFRFVGIGYNGSIMLAAVLGTLLYLALSTKFKYVWLSVVLILVLPKPLFFVDKIKYLIKDATPFINSLISNMYITEDFYKYFSMLMYAVVPIIVVIFYFVTAIRKKVFVIIAIGYSILTLYFFNGMEKIYSTSNLYLISGLILFSYNNYVVKWQGYKGKNIEYKGNYHKKLISATVAAVLVISFIAGFLPHNKKPLTLEWFDRNIISLFEDMGGKEDESLPQISLKSIFNISSTGFQQNPQRLGGAIKIDNSLALEIKSTDDISGLHLRGTVKDYYNGHMWDKIDTSSTKFHKAIVFEAPSTIPYSSKKMEINHKKIKASTAFNVLYPTSVDNRWGYGFIDGNYEIYNPRIVKSGKPYTVEFRDYDITRELILARNPGFVEHYNSEMQKYLQLSPTIPDRVYDLTHKIISKYSTPYEQISAIENYLKKNYPYELETSELPANRDFVDYFLFDEKKGSCTYYATAMTVMCRIAKIPARYVEGFVIPEKNYEKNLTQVLNSDAHAWVEVYLDNVGWVTFDPTPGGNSMALDLTVSDVGGDEPNVDVNQPSTPTNDNQTTNGPKKPEQENEDQAAIAEKQATPWTITALKAGVVALGAVVLIILPMIVIYILRNRSIKKNKKFIKYIISKMMMYGKLQGHRYAEGETLREYLERLGKTMGLNLEEFTRICEESVYNRHKLKPEEYNAVLSVMSKAESILKKNIGWFKFHYKNFMNMYLFNVRKNR